MGKIYMMLIIDLHKLSQIIMLQISAIRQKII